MTHQKIATQNKSKRKTRICGIDGCTQKHYGLGFCSTHYRRFYRNGDPALNHSRKRGVCKIDDCIRMHYASGFCRLHWERLRKGISLELPIRRKTIPKKWDEINWRPDKNGYIVGFFKGTRFAQHRIIWEQHHGRALQQFENIHHINGIRHDNRIENLELWVTAQPSGQRPEDLAAWVVEHYPELVAEKMKETGRL